MEAKEIHVSSLTKIKTAVRDKKDRYAHHVVVIDKEGNESKATILTFGSFENEQQAMKAFAF